jgi:hypothetical protein
MGSHTLVFRPAPEYLPVLGYCQLSQTGKRSCLSCPPQPCLHILLIHVAGLNALRDTLTTLSACVQQDNANIPQ